MQEINLCWGDFTVVVVKKYNLLIKQGRQLTHLNCWVTHRLVLGLSKHWQLLTPIKYRLKQLINICVFGQLKRIKGKVFPGHYLHHSIFHFLNFKILHFLKNTVFLIIYAIQYFRSAFLQFIRQLTYLQLLVDKALMLFL